MSSPLLCLFWLFGCCVSIHGLHPSEAAFEGQLRHNTTRRLSQLTGSSKHISQMRLSFLFFLRHSNSLCRPSGLCEVTLCCLQLLHLSVCSSWLPFGMPSVSYVSFLFISLAFSLHCVFWAFYLLLCILSSLLVGLGSLGCFIFIYSAFVNKACFLFFPFPASCVCACVLKHWYVQLLELFTIQLLDR